VLAAGSRDGSVWRWNISRPGHPVATGSPLSNATDWVNAVAFSPDGHTIAAASSDDQVLLWNAVTGQLLGTLPGPQPVTSLAWDGNHTLIAGGADGMIRLWRVPGPILLAGGGVNNVSFSPASGLLAVAGPDLQLWNTRTRAMTAAADSTGTFANTVAWAPGGRLLAAGYGAGYLRLYQVSGGRLTPIGAPLTATSHGLIEYVAFSPSGQLLASAADDGTVRLWSLADPAHPHQVAILHDAGDNYVFSTAFSPSGQVLAAASSDNLVRLWNVRDPARPRPIGRTLTGPEGYVYSVAFSPDGSTLAAGSTDGTIWLWNLSDPARPTLITDVTDALTPTGHVYSVAFSPDGGTLAAGSSDGSVRLWDIRPTAAIATLCALAGQPISAAEWRSFIPGRPYQPPCRR
jgi:WD40 repeat protein